MALTVVCEARGGSVYQMGFAIIAKRGVSITTVEKRIRKVVWNERKKKNVSSVSIVEAVKKALIGKARIIGYETIIL